MNKTELMQRQLVEFTLQELIDGISDLRALINALYAAMEASDRCDTWAYYGRSSREELRTVAPRLTAMENELSWRQRGR